MIIKVLGSGCKKCVALAKYAETAAATAGKQVEIRKVTDIEQIASYGLMSTPGLVIDDRLVSSGEVLTSREIAALL